MILQRNLRDILCTKPARLVLGVFFIICYAHSSIAQIDSNSSNVTDRGQLQRQIDAQLVELLETKKNETPFSLKLGENYFNYGLLLTEFGSYQEANDAFEDSLHIQKTNHGIDSAQQLPALEVLFDNNFAVLDIENAESYVARAVRVEEKNPEIKDRPSVKMQLQLGHYYLDKLENSDFRHESAAKHLRLASQYFMAVIEQNKDRPLDQIALPFGELAMTNYLGNKIIRKPEVRYEDPDPFPPTFTERLAELNGISLDSEPLIVVNAPVDDIIYNDYLNGAVPRAMEALKEYFNKAYAEEDVEEALYASLALGDINYLVGRINTADDYYAVAGNVANILPETHPQRLELEKPMSLPAFSYAYTESEEDNEFNIGVESISVPLQFNVDQKGRISKIVSIAEIDSRLLTKAKRELRDLTFRPALVNGERVTLDDFIYNVSVPLK